MTDAALRPRQDRPAHRATQGRIIQRTIRRQRLERDGTSTSDVRAKEDEEELGVVIQTLFDATDAAVLDEL